jgi:uncharacterized membrane protein YraQ (UPF0718 family)
MKEVINYAGELILQTLKAVGTSLMHNWAILAVAILLAVILKTYVNSDKLSKALFRRKKISVLASVAFGAFTPLCACGTMAVIIGMLTTTFPWGPIMAFLTSSPLMSPDGFVMISGIIGVRFAVALTIASVMIGLSSGFITNVIEKRTGFLARQSRFTGKEPIPACSCNGASEEAVPALTQSCSCAKAEKVTDCSCGEASVQTEGTLVRTEDTSVCTEDTAAAACFCSTRTAAAAGSRETGVRFMKSQYYNANWRDKFKQCCIRCCIMAERAGRAVNRKFRLKELMSNLFTLGIKQILLFYSIFVAVGFIINYFIPSSIVSLLFGANAFYAVPLASAIGLPLYITTDSGIPIIQSMLQNGASEGAMLAFMISGSATSAWVIAGLATFLKKRAIMLYTAFILAGAILSGYLLDFINLFL